MGRATAPSGRHCPLGGRHSYGAGIIHNSRLHDLLGSSTRGGGCVGNEPADIGDAHSCGCLVDEHPGGNTH